jgi:hypothetical protein
MIMAGNPCLDLLLIRSDMEAIYAPRNLGHAGYRTSFRNSTWSLRCTLTNMLWLLNFYFKSLLSSSNYRWRLSRESKRPLISSFSSRRDLFVSDSFWLSRLIFYHFYYLLTFIMPLVESRSSWRVCSESSNFYYTDSAYSFNCYSIFASWYIGYPYMRTNLRFMFLDDLFKFLILFLGSYTAMWFRVIVQLRIQFANCGRWCVHHF